MAEVYEVTGKGIMPTEVVVRWMRLPFIREMSGDSSSWSIIVTNYATAEACWKHAGEFGPCDLNELKVVQTVARRVRATTDGKGLGVVYLYEKEPGSGVVERQITFGGKGK